MQEGDENTVNRSVAFMASLDFWIAAVMKCIRNRELRVDIIRNCTKVQAGDWLRW